MMGDKHAVNHLINEIRVPNPSCFVLFRYAFPPKNSANIYMLNLKELIRIWKVPIFSRISSCTINVNM